MRKLQMIATCLLVLGLVFFVAGCKKTGDPIKTITKTGDAAKMVKVKCAGCNKTMDIEMGKEMPECCGKKMTMAN